MTLSRSTVSLRAPQQQTGRVVLPTARPNRFVPAPQSGQGFTRVGGAHNPLARRSGR